MDLAFVDTGAFIALFDEPDHHHHRAEETYRVLVVSRTTLVITNHVVDETCTWLLRHTRNGHQAALQFGRLIERAVAITDSSDLSAGAVYANSLAVLYTTPEI